SRNGYRKTVECKTIFPVPMGRVFEFFWKTDNIKGIKGTFLDTNATTNTEFFRNNRFTVFADYYCLISGSYPGTVDDTFGSAFLRMAAILMDNGYSHGDQKELKSGWDNRIDGDIIGLRY